MRVYDNDATQITDFRVSFVFSFRARARDESRCRRIRLPSFTFGERLVLVASVKSIKNTDLIDSNWKRLIVGLTASFYNCALKFLFKENTLASSPVLHWICQLKMASEFSVPFDDRASH
jgi:hypothetical protein